MSSPIAAPYGAASATDDMVSAFCGELDRFLSKRVDSAKIDAEHRLPEGLLGELADLGTFGVSIPERWGGSELGLGGACAVVDTLAQHDRGVATTVGLHLGLGTRGLVAFASDEQRDRWLPDLAAGKRLGAFATTEPNAGSDLSRLSTRGRFDAATGKIRIDGQKIWVTNGGLARTYTVAVATEGLGNAAHGQNLMLLDRDDKGLVVGNEEHKLGLRGSSTTTLFLDDIQVDTDRVVGVPGAGHRTIAQVLAFGRTAMAAGCNGTAQAALDRTVAHVAERKQFQKPLVQQPVIRMQLADMAAGLYAMRAIVSAVAEVEHDELGLERRSLAAKVYCSETDWAICDMAVQLHGGSGYIEETGIPLYLRDARITRIFEGANDVLCNLMGVLEMMKPGARVETGTAADLVSAVAEETRAAWHAKDGLKVLRDPMRLHKLGRLAMLREVAVATARYQKARPSTATRTLHDHVLTRLVQQAQTLAATDAPGATIDPIVDTLLEAIHA